MSNLEFLNSHLFTWVVLPLLIFCARIVDVSIGTIRIIFVSRGRKIIAPLLGFIEVIIWLLAISQIMKNLTNVACYIAYGGGFAMGTYIGILLEEKMALGSICIRIITSRNADQLIGNLRENNYGVTCLDAEGGSGPTNIVYTVIKRRDLSHVTEIIKRFNPRAF